MFDTNRGAYKVSGADYAMMKLAYKDALQRIDDLVTAIHNCQGWQEALTSNDPGNVTVWLGPRLHQIQDEVKRLVG
jgi:hypothetical protein